jgi:putative N6-adenine-specific DNA methylase
MPEHFFSPCPRGLEEALSRELETLGAAETKTTPGGAHYSGPFSLCYRVNLESRIASRVLWRLDERGYRSEDDIYQAVYALPWPELFDVRATIRVNVSAVQAPVKSLDFITLRVKDAVCDRFRATTGARPDVSTERPDVRIHAHLSASELSLYLDTSGEPLFKRGWRKETGDAPLRENLAAGILGLAGWRPDIPLLDPMCGSGTFLVEAAQMARSIPPGANRRFAFERLANLDAAAWRAIQEQASESVEHAAEIHGADIDQAMVAAARKNLAAAGVAGIANLERADVLQVSPPTPEGIIVTNPPYGVRTGEQARLAQFYPRLGDALKQRFAGWTAYLFSADPRLPKLIGLKASKRIPLYNGALECRLYEYRIVSGTLKSRPAAKS